MPKNGIKKTLSTNEVKNNDKPFDLGPFLTLNPGLTLKDFDNIKVDEESKRLLRRAIQEKKPFRFANIGIIDKHKKHKKSITHFIFQPTADYDITPKELKLLEDVFRDKTTTITDDKIKTIVIAVKDSSGLVHDNTLKYRKNLAHAMGKPCKYLENPQLIEGISCTLKNGALNFINRSTQNFTLQILNDHIEYAFMMNDFQLNKQRDAFIREPEVDTYHLERSLGRPCFEKIISSLRKELAELGIYKLSYDRDECFSFSTEDFWETQVRYNKKKYSELLLRDLYVTSGLENTPKGKRWPIESDEEIIEQIFEHAETLDIKLDVNQIPLEYAEEVQAMTALMFAAIKGNATIVDLLLQNGADATLCGKHGYNALQWAIAKNHPNIVKKILAHSSKKLNLNQLDHEGRTPLMLAAHCGFTEIVKLLLTYKRVNVNYSVASVTALKLAAAVKKFDVAVLLLKAGAHLALNDPNDLIYIVNQLIINRNNSKWINDSLHAMHKAKLHEAKLTPLMIAAKEGFHETVDYLLTYRHANIEEKDSSGNTVFHVAMSIPNPAHKTISVLLKHSATHINHENNDFNTPFDLAVQRNHIFSVNDLMNNAYKLKANIKFPVPEDYISIVKYLLNNGFKPGKMSINTTIENLIFVAGSEQLILRLLKEGYPYQQNLILTAAQMRYTKLIEYLLKNNKIHDRSYIAKTLIYFIETNQLQLAAFIETNITKPADKLDMIKHAISDECPVSIKYLLKDKKYLHLKDSQGDTVLHGVCNDLEILKYFLALDKTLINTKNNDGQTPFDRAIRCQAIDSCNLLWKNGGRPSNAVLNLDILDILRSPLNNEISLYYIQNNNIEDIIAAEPEILEDYIAFEETALVYLMLNKIFASSIKQTIREKILGNALTDSVEVNRDDYVTFLTEHHVKSNYLNSSLPVDERSSPLLAAIEKNNKNMLSKLLLSDALTAKELLNGIKITIKNKDSKLTIIQFELGLNKLSTENINFLFLEAVTDDLLDVVQCVLKACKERLTMYTLTTSFVRAASLSGKQMIELLFNNCHMDINTRSMKSGNAALTVVANHSDDSDEIVDFLIEHKADPNLLNKKGESPIELAAAFGHINTLKKLIKAGADYKSSNVNIIVPPLVSACRNGQLHIAKYLISIKAPLYYSQIDPVTNTFTLTQRSLLDLDFENIVTKLPEDSLILQIFDLLVTHCPEDFHKNKDQYLLRAISLKNIPLVEAILARGVDPKKQIVEVAVARGGHPNKQIVEATVAHESYSNKQISESKITPLTQAIRSGDKTMIQFFLDLNVPFTLNTFFTLCSAKIDYKIVMFVFDYMFKIRKLRPLDIIDELSKDSLRPNLLTAFKITFKEYLITIQRNKEDSIVHALLAALDNVDKADVYPHFIKCTQKIKQFPTRMLDHLSTIVQCSAMLNDHVALYWLNKATQTQYPELNENTPEFAEHRLMIARRYNVDIVIFNNVIQNTTLSITSSSYILFGKRKRSEAEMNERHHQPDKRARKNLALHI